MFTFSFSTAFAVSSDGYYTYDEVTSALEATRDAQLAYVNAAVVYEKAQFAFDTNGFASTYAGVSLADQFWAKCQKDAVMATLNEVYASAQKVMKAEIANQLDSWDKTFNATDLTDAKNAVIAAVTSFEYNAGDNTADITTAEGVNYVLNGTEMQTFLAKAQEPATKAYYEGLIAKNYNPDNYADTGVYKTSAAATTSLTAKGVIEYIVAKAETSFASIVADKSKTAAEKIDAYIAAYNLMDDAADGGYKYFTKNGDGSTYIQTVTSADEAAAAEAILVDAAVAKYKDKLLTELYDAYKLDLTAYTSATTTVNYESLFNAFNYPAVAADEQPIYVAATATTKAKVFGVEVANVNKVTRAEAVAINAAWYQAMLTTVDAVEVYLESEGSAAVSNLNNINYTVARALLLDDVYEDVVEYGATLKNLYLSGVKQYDDAKVDAAVEAAKAFVFADLDTTAQNAKAYLADGVAKVNNKTYADDDAAIAALLATTANELAKFNKAIADAVDKFDTTIVTYGTKKTPEVDKMYCRNYYAVAKADSTGITYGEYWDYYFDAATGTMIAKLNAVESYAELDAVMAEAEEILAGFMTKAEGDKIDKFSAAGAVETYKAVLGEYEDSMAALYGADYSDALVAALAEGEDLIEDAITLDGVKAAFEEAKALFANLKSNDTIEDEAEAVDKLIEAIPSISKLTVADKAAVEAARVALDALVNTEDVLLDTRLATAEAKIFELEQDALEDEVKALNKKITALGANILNDKAAEAAVALKAEAEALQAKVDAHNDAVSDYADEYVAAGNVDTFKTTYSVTNTTVDTFLAKDRSLANNVYAAELYLARTAIRALNVAAGAIDAEKVAEAEALYNALTEKQQFVLASEGVAAILANAKADIAEVKIAAIEGLKIKASSTKAKGSITVKWTVDEKVEGVKYQVYKSTKAHTGYIKSITTTKTSFKNTKNLKAGTRYYYKVRAIGVVDGVTYYSDWSNKANRVAK